MSALVSVVIPVFNGERFLAEALASVAAQGHRPIEVVVVDDGSTDASAEVAATMAGVRLLRQANAGVAAARNTGVAACRGELIAFLDQDDRWLPHKLAIQVEHLATHPELGYVLGRQRMFLEPGTEAPGWLKAELLDQDQIGYLPGTLVVRSEVLARVGPFDPARPIASDADWFMRAKDAGVPMAVVPELVLERRIHAGNLSRQTAAGHAELLHAVRRSIARQRERGGQGGAP